jgi:hypothetical protein
MPLFPTLAQETPSSYSSFPLRGMVYEVSLRVRNSADDLKDLGRSHRVVQSLLRGQLLGLYDLMDFILWPEGLFLRVSLKGFATLSEFLTYLKGQALHPDSSRLSLWDDDLEWIRVIPPEGRDESTLRFLEQASRLRGDLDATAGFDPNLFFYYRNPSL